VRVLNGAADGAPRDVAIDGQFSPPLFAAVPFAEATEFASVPSGDHTLNVTPPGNPGALELNQTITTTAPSYYTLIFGGEAGALTHVLVPDERRRVAGAAKLRFFNAASQFSSLDFLVAFENGDINLVFPQAVLGAPGASSSIVLQPGTYKFALRQSSTTNIVAEPQTLTVESGGLYGVLAINGPDTSTATMVLLDDF
jgi:hypothetical protein